ALGHDRDELLQVGAHAVHVLNAGQDGDKRLVVVAEPHPAVGELPAVLEGERIARLGAVDGDGDEVAVLLVVNRHGGTALTPASRRAASVAAHAPSHSPHCVMSATTSAAWPRSSSTSRAA